MSKLECLKVTIPVSVSLFYPQCTMKGVKCDLDAVDMQFRSPLHWAAVLGLSEIMTLLLNYGANPTIADAVGATALHYAVSITSPNGCLICVFVGRVDRGEN